MDLYYYFIGRFAGNGWFEKRGIGIATRDEKDAVMLFGVMERVFGKKPKLIKRTYRDGHTLYILRLWSVKVHSELLSIFKTTKKSKKGMSPNIKNLCEGLSFLKGFFDSEAWIYEWRGKTRISLETYNENFLNTIKKILEKTRTRYSVSKCKDGAYLLNITGRHAHKLINLLTAPPCPGESRL